jgi:hypothetical protein
MMPESANTVATEEIIEIQPYRGPGIQPYWIGQSAKQSAIAYAQDHRIAVEEDKGKERGFYLYPAGFNEPKGKAVGPTGKLFADQSPNLENVASSQ